MSSQAPAQPDQTWLEMQPVPEFLTFMPWARGTLQAWRVLGAAHTPPPGRSRAARQWEARGPHSRAERDLEPSGLLWKGPTDQGRRERASLIRHTQVQRGCSTQLWCGSEGDQGARLGTVGGLCGWEALGSLGQVSARVLVSQDADSGHTCHAGQDHSPLRSEKGGAGASLEQPPRYQEVSSLAWVQAPCGWLQYPRMAGSLFSGPAKGSAGASGESIVW